MENVIKIGKYTLESLTTGMYTDPKIIYREYIQNSVDAIEEAVNNGYMEIFDAKIEIIIDPDEYKVTIYDNGAGIKSNEAYNTLTDIGNSKKKHTNNRGFRGIGRLGGLSYCDKLIFTTSYKGENTKAIVVFNCKRLKELLIPGEYDQVERRKGRIKNLITLRPQQSFLRVEVYWKQDDKYYFDVYNPDDLSDELLDEIDKIYNMVAL